MDPFIDSRVVRTIRCLRQVQTHNESFSTRTSTPSQDSQILEIISNREEFNQFKPTVSVNDLYEILKNDFSILRDLQTEPVLSQSQLKKISEKVADHQETIKIQDAKRQMTAKIQERMENLKKQLADSHK